MAKLKLRWTGTALAEFGRMLAFYNTRNGNDKYSRTIIRRVNESLKLVVKFPRMYRLVDAEEVKGIRMFHCDYFLIYYKADDSEVIVEAVFDTRQDPEKAPY